MLIQERTSRICHYNINVTSMLKDMSRWPAVT